MKVGFIGAGKVGFSLGKFMAEHGVHVTGYYSRHVESALEAAEFANVKCYETLEHLVKDCDVLFLTVPDGEIEAVYQDLKKYDIKNKQICHCSGSLSARETFPDVKQLGAFGYSIHPLFPVSSKLTSYRELSGAFFCLEGDGPHLDMWIDFFSKNAKGVRKIDSMNKVRYHAACAIASNLYCALMQQSLDLLACCGFEEKEALEALAPLVESNVLHILDEGPVKALTGPVERCDVGTVQKHLRCFPDETGKELYRAVSSKLVEVAEKKNPDRDYTQLKILLNAYDSED